MMIDDEVFAVIMAIVVLGSVFAAVQLLPRHVEPLEGIALLNPECKMKDYPSTILAGEGVSFCLLVFNYMGKPMYYQVRYKVGDRDTLPRNETPSPQPALKTFEVVLNDSSEAYLNITITVERVGNDIALIFELWRYEPATDSWVYTGKWNHLYVDVVEVLPS